MKVYHQGYVVCNLFFLIFFIFLLFIFLFFIIFIEKKIITLVFATADFVLAVKMICRIALESASKAFCLLKSAAINL